MTAPSPDITLDVNLRNPGQFFACCGLLELASRLWPESEGWFAGGGSRASFHVATRSGHNDPLGAVVDKLCEPRDLVAVPREDGVEALQADRRPVVLLPFGLRLDWWLHSYRNGDRSELKVWAGQQTPEGKINDLREVWRRIRAEIPSSTPGLLAQGRPISGRFGFDPAASWNALDVGFSPDEQGVPVQTSPATEILAAVGLQRCRPAAVGNKRRWFSYRAWQTPLDIAVVPAVIAGATRQGAAYEFPVEMRNQQYGNFGWAKPLEGRP